MKKVYFCFGLAFLFTVPAYSQTIACPAGTEDMLEYFAMGYPARSTHHMGSGNANPFTLPSFRSAVISKLGVLYLGQRFGQLSVGR